MKYIFFIFLFFINYTLFAQSFSSKIIVGAQRTTEYFNKLKNKRIALVVNQTSLIHRTHLVDSLYKAGFTIAKIFAPEHGFRGTGDAGEKINNDIDPKTNIPIISLYGKNKKPTTAMMANLDMVVFDIQDVGVRFYTYISTLQYIMEACADSKVPLLLLDRPNPNGFYIDGPVLDPAYKSFVGMQRIPIVHGMTVGEYATMLNNEKLLNTKNTCNLTVIPCKNYNHNTLYHLPVPPSPNLKSTSAILLYPSLCLFEGTIVSVGRGTSTPFEVWGNPTFKNNGFSFTPQSSVGAKSPLYENQICYGANLNLPPDDILKIIERKINLTFLHNALSLCKDTSLFFNDFFEKLSGNKNLRKQLLNGIPEEKIRATWKADIDKFKKIRKKYLLYPDFE